MWKPMNLLLLTVKRKEDTFTAYGNCRCTVKDRRKELLLWNNPFLHYKHVLLSLVNRKLTDW